MKERKRVENPMKVLSRVIKYMTVNYKFSFLVVVVCIITAAIANLVGITFMQTLIDDYILPMAQNGGGDFSALAEALLLCDRRGIGLCL